MNERNRLLLLITILTSISFIVGGIAVLILYEAAFEEEKARLVETAQSQARLIEAVARYNSKGNLINSIETVEIATLNQISDAHEHYQGFGETGEFVLAKRVKNQIVFLLRHRHFDLDSPQPIPFDDNTLAEPMRRALLNQSGTIIGLDYRGETVLAAYEPVKLLNFGVVVKIDLSEIRFPFFKAALQGIAIASVLIFFGTWLFFRITNPIIHSLEKHKILLEKKVELRTHELATSNEQLEKEIIGRQQIEKTSQESEVKYRSMFDNAWDGISVVNSKGIFIEVNPALCQMIGYTKEELIGTSGINLIHPNLREEVNRYLLQVKKMGRAQLESVQMHKDGTPIPIEIRGTVFNYMGQSARLSTIRDITERKSAEKQFNQHNQLLEQAVQEKTKEMEEMTERMVRQEKLITIGQISGSIAHELRNPLGAIKQAVFYLKEIIDPNQSEVIEFLDLINSEAISANHVITDLLEMTKADEPNRQRLDLRSILEEIMKKSYLKETIDLHLELESEPFELWADANQMHQVFVNLLTNANQANSKDHLVIIRARELKNKEHEIQIEDKGCGIPATDLEKVFEPLFTTRSKGTGLGLSICRQIIEKHQGTITLQSALEEGTTVQITLPQRRQTH